MALDGDPILSALHLSVEEVGGVIRIGGSVPDVGAIDSVREVARAAAPGFPIDTDGVSVPPAPTYQFVQAGDTLWTIAARVYGDPYQWPAIAKANLSVNPKRLEVGSRLLLPVLP